MSARRDHFVYWLYDASGNPLYVGMTKFPEQRLRQHRRKHWFGQVAFKRMAGPFTKETARILEREEQDELQPRYDARQKSMRARARNLPNAETRWALADIAHSHQLMGVTA